MLTWWQTEIFAALPSPRIQTEWTQPFVDGHRDRCYVQHEYDDPQFRGKGQQKCQQWYLRFGICGQQWHTAKKVWRTEVNHFSTSSEFWLLPETNRLRIWLVSVSWVLDATNVKRNTHLDTLNGAKDMSAEPAIKSPIMPFQCSSTEI